MAKKPPRATEQRNPRTRGLDTKSTLDILRAIHREDATVARAVARAIPAIARAVDAITLSLRHGGRLFYVGAGTSGRLAALDAAEIPPTFGTPPRMVQAVIAGGRRALTHAVEGAEDNPRQGARDLVAHGLNRNDVVVGITASGSTPYVLGALEFARRRGATTVGVAANPRTPITRLAAISIVTETGPEAITGSTRMKAGTSTEIGPKYAIYRCDGSTWTRVRQLDDRRGADESEVAGERAADIGGSFRSDRGRIDTRPASSRTQHGYRPHYVTDRFNRPRGAAAFAQRWRQRTQGAVSQKAISKGSAETTWINY